jgi:cell division protein FtsN
MDYFIDMRRSLNQAIYTTSVFMILLLSISCAAQKNGGKPYYHEDLYSLRPKFQEPVDSIPAEVHQKVEVVPTHNVNRKVDGVLDSINHFNATRKFIEGYTIQIYSGQNREEAMNAKKKMTTDLPGLNAEMDYNQPTFRVRVGSYYSRLDAQKDLLRLRRPFPNAILVPEKILVR